MDYITISKYSDLLGEALHVATSMGVNITPYQRLMGYKVALICMDALHELWAQSDNRVPHRPDFHYKGQYYVPYRTSGGTTRYKKMGTPDPRQYKRAGKPNHRINRVINESELDTSIALLIQVAESYGLADALEDVEL